MRLASLISIDRQRDLDSSRRGRLGSRAGRSILALSVLAVLPLFAACGPSRKDVVVEGKGWRLTLPEVESEYNRLNGEGKFTQATARERETFVRTVADKEILLRMARQKYPKLDFRQNRQLRFEYEDALYKDYAAARRAAFKATDEELQAARKLLSREAKAIGTLFATEQEARLAIEEVKQGASFEDVSLRRGMQLPPNVEGGSPVLQAVTIRPDDPQVHPPFFAETFLKDVPVGGLTEPVSMRGGWAVLKMESYRDLPEASEPGFFDKTGNLVPNLLYYRHSLAWLDSLRQAANYRVHPESFPVVRERMVAFWDSLDALRTSGVEVDYGILPAPSLYSLTREQRDVKVCEMFGETQTVEKFFRSLEEYDLSRWPFGDSVRMANKVRERCDRMLVQKEAEKVGIPKTPAFSAKMKRLNEQALLTLYHDSLWNGEPTEEEYAEAYKTIPASQIMRAHRLSLSGLIYPAELKGRAEEMRNRLREEGPDAWERLAPAEHEADSRILYVPPTRMLEPGRPCPISAWEPMLIAVTQLEEGAITEVVPGKNVYYIVKSVQVLPAGQMTLEEARGRLLATVRSARQDSLLEEVLAEARAKEGVQIKTDLLAQGAPPDSAKSVAQPSAQGNFRIVTGPTGTPTGTRPSGAPAPPAGAPQPSGSGRP